MKNLLSTVCLALGLGAFLPAAPAAAQEPFIGQIIYFPYSFCPRSFTEADGQLLPIAQYTALFSLYGTTFGGDGRTTLGLPNLKGRVPIQPGRGPGLTERREGSFVGAPSVTLNETNLANHTHRAVLTGSSTTASSASPDGTALGVASFSLYAGRATLDASLHSETANVVAQGGSQSIDLMQPFLTLRPCVALQGLYPSRS